MEPRFEKARHIKYWTRCLKTMLPHQYTGLESNRMYLAFLMLSALDLLDCLHTVCSAEERRDYIDWIYRCQHPEGGFRMWPGTDFGERANQDNAKWDPANVPATYFALGALLVLDDDFKRVQRRRTLQWLRQMQRTDGSFGETLVEGRLEGGRDPRFGYCAAGIRHILGGHRKAALRTGQPTLADFDVDALVRCVRAAESFDGGIADESLHEPHAGYTFCSLGALSFVNRLNKTVASCQDTTIAPFNPLEVVRWLVYRQTDELDPDGALDSEFATKASLTSAPTVPIPTSTVKSHQPSEDLHQSPDKSVLDPTALRSLPSDCVAIGMNGRPNKVADTCYAWWAGASLHLLDHAELYDRQGIRRYLLEKTQHPVLGGFGKFAGDLPDLYHSCLGLAALSLAGEKEIKEVHPGMCVSRDAARRLDKLWSAWDSDVSDEGEE